MEVKQVKDLIDTYYEAGKQRLNVVDIVSALPINGESVEAFQYIDLKYQVGEPDLFSHFRMSDAGNGEALATACKSVARYVYEWRSWIIYTGKYWQQDTDGFMRRLAVGTMRGLYKSLADAVPDEKQRLALAKWFISSENERRINAAITLATANNALSVRAGDLDDKPWLLNVSNGTIDLKTGELQKHHPDDLLTQFINIPWDRNAYSEEWHTFLSDIFEGKEDLIDFVQRGAGCSINGAQQERVFFFLYGLGKNGKSQLMDALRRVLGPYAGEAKPELFMEKRFASGGPDEGQAALKGIRLLTATEVKRGQKLDISLIKRMTGGEPIWHERKFQAGFNFQPTHTLWLSGNHEPEVKDTTNSIWDRLMKIPFDYRVPPEKEVKGYGEYLAVKYPTEILNWCIEGALKWKQIGLTDTPPSVSVANEEYRARQDILRSFIDNCLEQIAGENITLSETYKKYVAYCQNDDVDPIGKRTFNEAMREHGFRDKRGTGNKPSWMNVRFSEQKHIFNNVEKAE